MKFSYHQPAPLAATGPVRLTRAEIWVCHAPIDMPVETSFGVMRSRPAVFVRLEDSNGAFGFGEVWCNFPSCGAEHRARLLAEELAPLALAQEFGHPSEIFQRLSGKVRIRALQSGEPGPYAQAIAGLDIAMWDLFARKAGLPVRLMLDPGAADSVPAYASGIHIRQAETMLAKARAKGYHAFKVRSASICPVT